MPVVDQNEMTQNYLQERFKQGEISRMEQKIKALFDHQRGPIGRSQLRRIAELAYEEQEKLQAELRDELSQMYLRAEAAEAELTETRRHARATPQAQ